MRTTVRVASNFIAKYGVDTLDWMLGQFKAGTSQAAIARKLGVSRSRVNQWQATLGTTVRAYEPHLDIRTLVE